MLNSFETSKDRKIAIYLIDVISRVIEEIGFKNTVLFIMDNAQNYESAGSMLTGKHSHLDKTRCTTHEINLPLKDINNEIVWVKEVIDNIKLTLTYL